MAPGTDGWARLCTLQWRFTLALLRIGGHFCSAGWPPSPTRAWTRYCVLVMALFTVAKVVNLQLYLPDILRPADGSFVSWLLTADVLTKSLASIVLQIMLILRRFELAALVQCLDSYVSWCAPSLRAWRGMTLVLAAYLASSFLLPIVSIVMSSLLGIAMRSTVFYATDLVPTLHTALADSAFVAVLAACVFLGQDAADDVRDQIHAVARRGGEGVSPEEDLRTALQLRELRTRQQALQDVIRASNRAHGGASLCCLFITVVEATNSTFAGIYYLRGDPGTSDISGQTAMVWGVTLMLRFMANCVLGEQLCNTRSRISNALQGLLVNGAILPVRTTSELQGFSHQVQMQDCRCGVYDLLYFDFTTMGAVIGSFATFLVILFQFDPAWVTNCECG